MKRLEEILQNENRVGFELEEKDFKTFLRFAKCNGCTWLNGDEIDVDNNHISHHMSIQKTKLLAFVPVWAWFAKIKNPIKKIQFSKLAGGEQ